MGKINVYNKIVIGKREKGEKIYNQIKFYINLHLKDGLGMVFTLAKSS